MKGSSASGTRRKRVAFLGAEETGWRCLNTLFEIGANVVGIFTLTDEKAENTVAARSLDDLAKPDVPLYKIDDINSGDAIEQLSRLQPDLLYQVSWSQLLEPDVLAVPSETCVGMHLSLLPKHRGRAPIPWSIIFNLRRSGMTLFHLTREADLGDIIGQVEFTIGPHDTAADVYEKGVRAAEELIRTFHPQLVAGTAPRRSQDPKRSDFWPRRRPQDGLIDWDRTAESLYAWIRALTRPFPGAFTFFGEDRLFIWAARPAARESNFRPGQVLEASPGEGIVVGTGEGTLRLDRLQLEDEMELDADEFAQRHGLREGRVLG